MTSETPIVVPKPINKLFLIFVFLNMTAPPHIVFTVLFADEITANLDEDSLWDILMLLIEINRRGTTVIMATHASKYVNILRRRVVTLVHGRVLSLAVSSFRRPICAARRRFSSTVIFRTRVGSWETLGREVQEQRNAYNQA